MSFKLPPVPPKDPEARRALFEQHCRQLLTLAANAAAEGRLKIISSARGPRSGEKVRIQSETPPET